MHDCAVCSVSLCASRMSSGQLSDDLWEAVLKKVLEVVTDVKDVAKCICVCRAWRQFLQAPEHWRDVEFNADTIVALNKMPPYAVTLAARGGFNNPGHPAALGKFTQLEQLLLRQFREVPWHSLSASLRSMYMWQVNPVSLDGLQHLSNLKRLTLVECLDIRVHDAIGALSALTMLDLNRVHTLTPDLGWASTLTGLRTLALSQVEGLENMQCLTALTSLTELHVQTCSELQTLNISALSQLVNLYVRGNGNLTSMVGLDDLRTRLRTSQVLDNPQLVW